MDLFVVKMSQFHFPCLLKLNLTYMDPTMEMF